MMSREDALLQASSITKALAAARGHTHFIKTLASFMRKYSRNDHAYDNGDEFNQLVLREFCDYLSNLCGSIEHHRDEIRLKNLVEEEKALYLVEANGIHLALRKVINELENYTQETKYAEKAMSYLPGLPENWSVSKKGKSLVVTVRTEEYIENKAN